MSNGNPGPSKVKALKTLMFKKKGIGIRGKLVIFLIIPLILALMLGGYLTLRQVTALTGLISKESSIMVTQLAEREIANNARAAAIQVRLFLSSHPELKKEGFQNDPDFKRISVQKVGVTGYSALYELPDPDGIWRTWAHENPKIVGIDMSTLQKAMGKAFEGFWKVYTDVKEGKEASGYYTWQDPDGSFRDKFMVCTPVEGTPYIIASTTYLDEFTLPLKRLERSSQQISTRARDILGAILIGTILIIGLIIYFYGRALIGNIRRLSEVADRISLGEMDAEIKIKSKDEIGELAEAILRMQESIRLAIERLRRRK